MVFTRQARKRLLQLLGEKRVTFRYRFENGKLKKVSGKYVYFSHQPGKGFFIHLKNVRMRGGYCYGLELKFSTRRITWYTREQEEMVCQTLFPRLAAIAEPDG